MNLNPHGGAQSALRLVAPPAGMEAIDLFAGAGGFTEGAKGAGRKEFGDCFVAPYYSNGSGLTGRSIARPIGTFSTVDRWAIIRGNEMRMFQPPEVRAGMGFPDTYILPNTRREAIHLMGNAVCPAVATDILDALKEAA